MNKSVKIFPISLADIPTVPSQQPLLYALSCHTYTSLLPAYIIAAKNNHFKNGAVWPPAGKDGGPVFSEVQMAHSYSWENFHLPTVVGATSVTGSLCVQQHLNTQLQEDFLQRYLGC